MEYKYLWKLGTAGLFKNAQMQGAQKAEPRGVYGYTLSGAVCSATQQMSCFQQPTAPVIPFLYQSTIFDLEMILREEKRKDKG